HREKISPDSPVTMIHSLHLWIFYTHPVNSTARHTLIFKGRLKWTNQSRIVLDPVGEPHQYLRQNKDMPDVQKSGRNLDGGVWCRKGNGAGETA
ncbi:MAG: hypothetical protein AAFW82_00410, partial [Pseudomonadota bacterium]